MKVFVFEAHDPPILEPIIIDSSDWKRLKDLPLHAVCVFGRCFKSDHIAIEENPKGHPNGSIMLSNWEDDAVDRTPDEMNAKQVIFEPPRMTRDGWKCIQRMTLFLPPILREKMYASKLLPAYNQDVPVKVKPLDEFPIPPKELTLHGVWETDENNAIMEKFDFPSYHVMV